MCGIWALFGIDYLANTTLLSELIKIFNKIKHRGPEKSLCLHEKNCLIGFHRLAIISILHGMQPMTLKAYPHITLICNGELYNCNLLRDTFEFQYETHCDVECIIHLYSKFGIQGTVRQLDGEYSFCLVDRQKKQVFVARDPYGVRPCYKLWSPRFGVLGVCSEAKGLVPLKELFLKHTSSILASSIEEKTCLEGVLKFENLKQFPPGTYEVYDMLDKCFMKHVETKKFFSPGDRLDFKTLTAFEELNRSIQQNISLLLEKAVEKRLMSDRRIGCFLSGGLDSSLIAALVVKLVKQKNFPYQIETFSIGMEGSPDMAAAQIVAKYLGTNHHQVILTEVEIKTHLEDIIYTLGSYDITTIRASIPMWLLSRYIKHNTETTVLLSGEGSDELTQGYIYFHNAPSSAAASEESKRLLSDIYLYDGLRADRTCAAFGLELRLPFLDIQFTNYFLSLSNDLRTPQKGIEKFLLRQSFQNSKLLPDEILWRKKEAFSDGVTSTKKSLYTILQEIIDSIHPSDDLEPIETGVQPISKESLFYKSVFQKYYSNETQLTPYYWMPKWSFVSDPSARFLPIYKSTV